MPETHRRLLSIALIGPMLALSGCFLVPLSVLEADGQDVIKIGVVASSSGTDAGTGESVENGAQLAVEQINRAGGILGKKVVLVKKDDQSDPDKAASKAAQLIDQGVVAIVGNVQSSTSKETLLRTAKPRGCVMVSPSSTSPAFSDPAKIDTGGYFFRTVPSDALQGKVLARIATDAGYQRLGILNIDNDYGNGLAEVLRASFEALPRHETLVATYSEDPTVSPSYSDVLTPLLSQGPDAVVLIAYAAGGSQIIKDWVSSGLRPSMPWLFSDGVQDPAFLPNISDVSRIEGMTGSYPFSAGPNYDRFASEYQARFKFPPGAFAENAYDATVLIALAVQRAGAASREAVKAELRAVASGPGEAIASGEAGVRSALAALAAGKEIDYQGASGPVDLDAHGDPTSGTYVVWEVRGGAIRFTDRILTP